MNDIIASLIDAANDIIPGRATITVMRDAEIEKWAYNDIHFEVQKFLDRIRQNENLDTFLTRKDSAESMCLEVGFSQHDKMSAIVRELTQKASNMSKRHGIKTIGVAVDEGLVEDIQAALELKKAALTLMAGKETRVIQGEGWTEKEALDDAMNDDEHEHGTGDGYGGGYGSVDRILKRKMVRAPKRAKRVKVEKAVVRKGPVKKVYTIDKQWGFSRNTMDPVEKDKRFKAQHRTQGEALKAARELAMEYGVELNINLEAFCVGDTRLAKVTPVGEKVGVWRFEVDFRS
jgi:hypothetical protein